MQVAIVRDRGRGDTWSWGCDEGGNSIIVWWDFGPMFGSDEEADLNR
jgi:hypothetical protein